MGHPDCQPVPAGRLQLGTLAAFVECRRAWRFGCFPATGVCRADLLRVQPGADLCCFSRGIETDTGCTVCDGRRRGLLHESIWRID
ncbi:hypothetical protein D3C80_1051620 [compost metagenome]